VIKRFLRLFKAHRALEQENNRLKKKIVRDSNLFESLNRIFERQECREEWLEKQISELRERLRSLNKRGGFE